jgi:hypothetical protein
MYLKTAGDFQMKNIIKKLFSNRLTVVVLAALLVLSVFNTYLILERTNTFYQSNVLDYDFVISQESNSIRLKNMLTGAITDGATSLSSTINNAFTEGKSIYINPGTYELTEDIYISNKLNPKIISDGATILGNGKSIIIHGDNWTHSQYSRISGLKIINGTIRIENSFDVTITNMIFKDSLTAVEIINSDTWSEAIKIENSHFINNTEGIAFRTPIGNATGSYASSEINSCFFNIINDSVGINVEELAEFSDSIMRNVRMWMGEYGFERNQTGLLLEGTMHQTVLIGVVFESFADYPDEMFGITLGNSSITPPILSGGVSFLGNWTAKVHNRYSKWIAGIGSVFTRENLNVPIGLDNQYGEILTIKQTPLKIMSFKPKIEIQGSFEPNEIVTVRIRLEFIDNSISKNIVRTFSNASSVWLSDDEILQLFPPQSIIWSVMVDAKSSAASTSVNLKVSGYGIVG